MNREKGDVMMSESECRARIAERVWMLKALQRAAVRAGKTFAVFLAGALALLVYATIAAGMMCSCTAQPREVPDAGPLPSCAAVCPSGIGLCKHDGVCSCDLGSGKTVECEREPPPDAAPATADACGAACQPRIDAP